MDNSKGVLFDLDGVIVDTARFHFVAWRNLANELGFDISLDQNEQLKGVSRVDSLKKILIWGNKTCSNAEFSAYLHQKNEDYLGMIAALKPTDLLPGVKEVLDFLTAEKVPFALGSASRNARPILNYLQIANRFAAVVDGNDVTKAKPDPEVFLIGARKLEVAPKNCIVFEDAVAGIQAANAVGMTSIGIGNAEVLQKADYNFTDFTQITTEFLQELITK